MGGTLRKPCFMPILEEWHLSRLYQVMSGIKVLKKRKLKLRG